LKVHWLTVEGMFELVYGFSMGTGVMEGMSLGNCTGSMQKLFHDLIEINDDLQVEFRKYNVTELDFSEYDLWPYLLINDKIIAVVYYLRELSNGCYYGGFEAYGILGNYFEWYYNPDIFKQKLVNNFGFIYANIRDMVLLY